MEWKKMNEVKMEPKQHYLAYNTWHKMFNIVIWDKKKGCIDYRTHETVWPDYLMKIELDERGLMEKLITGVLQ